MSEPPLPAGFTAGHWTDEEAATGCTVVLAPPDGAVASGDVRGGGPGTREIDLLNPIANAARVHAILMSGGHYTYAEMPLFSWLRDELHLGRNYYDRLGHLAQGFVPSMIAREILIRSHVVNGRGWLAFLVCSIALAISACYEFVEWWVAVASGTDADAFLATQGDVWDTQWDMFLALCGAILAQLTLTGLHDRQLEALAAAE